MIPLLLTISCVTPQRELRSQTRTQLGTAYLSENNPEDAITALEEATKLNPRNATAWEKLAIAYYAKGALEKSEKAFKKALRFEPEKAEIHNNYGLILLKEGRVDEAIEHFNIALADLSYRNTALVLNNLGQAYYQQKNYESSITILTQAVNRAPNLCQARFNRGISYHSLKKEDLALNDFNEVIELCGNTATGAYYQAALILFDMGDISSACRHLETVMREAGRSELGSLAKTKHQERCHE